MTEKERYDAKMTTIYELRLIVSSSDKENYSKDELLEMLDKIAMAKEQEN